MPHNNMTIKAHTKNVFAKGFGEFIRTVPASGHNSPYVGFIKTTLGEATVSYNNPVVFEVLVSGDEISEKEYTNSKLTVLNEI